LFDFSGQGANPGHTTLGFGEAAELHDVIDALAQRPDVDRARFGVWGTNVGAYAAMVEAESDPRVAAFAVESVYDRPDQELDLLVSRSGVAAMPMVPRTARWGFDWLARDYRGAPPLSAGVGRLVGVPKLYLEAEDEPDLAATTHQLFTLSPDPSEEATLDRGNYASMLDEEKHGYENRIVSFFLSNLPPASRARR